MKLPKGFVIKGEEWTVVAVPELTHNEEAVNGLTDYETRTISIDATIRGKLKDHSIVHEFIHATFEELHVNLDSTLEDVIADGLAKCLLDSFQMRIK